MRNALVGLLIIAAAVAVYQYVKSDQNSERSSAPITTLSGDDGSSFRCEGKTRCSEMRSCEEAKFYLQNCPGTKMDGDGDGVPCESQWCGE